MLRLEETLSRLQQVHITPGQANSTITQLAAEITNIKKNSLQEFYLLQNYPEIDFEGGKQLFCT